jgi:hypothetical protein
MQTELWTEDDLEWAREVHGLPREAKYAVLYGNEDAPDQIDWWKMEHPTIEDDRFTHTPS